MTELSLLRRYAETIASASPAEIQSDITLGGRLVLEQEGDLQINYAPFDFVNRQAKIVIVGITPGAVQATNALLEANRALRADMPIETVAARTKVFASFSGPMRTNLVSMLDAFGINKALGIATTAALFGAQANLVHFTSALRYPVFWRGKNYAGAPTMTNASVLARHLLQYTGDEFTKIPDALIVPLGGKASEALRWLAERGIVSSDRILDGVQHPSGANAERIAYLLGRKDKRDLSVKTNADKIDRDRTALLAKIRAWSPALA